ncbi:unnamed protein product [Oreochromis niloticus]|nr:unnamed protein product [Mustela putorius furo]
MGPPGSGKGTISKRIAQSFGLQYLSSGHFLREGIAAKTEAGLLVKTYVERSMLVPDHVMTRLMLPRLEQLSGHSWLLDGFPRTLGQALALNNLYQLDLVISLNIPYETLKERLSDRWIHPASGRVYNMGFNPPQVQGKDDITGEPLIQHDDDKPEALMARLRHYKDVAKPVTRNPALIFRYRDRPDLALYQFSPQHQDAHTAIRYLPGSDTMSLPRMNKKQRGRGGGSAVVPLRTGLVSAFGFVIKNELWNNGPGH